MAQRTLLEIVQNVLSAIDGDEVNSISDTVESLQIVDLVNSCFQDIVVEHDLPSTGSLRTLNGLADTTAPSTMQIPESVLGIIWIKYDGRADPDDPVAMRDVLYLSPNDFVNICNSRSSDDADVVVVNPAGSSAINIRTDSAPHYWTSFDDEYVIFDSIDYAVESTATNTATQMFAYIEPEFNPSDDYTPDLPANLHPYLYSQVLAKAFAFFKQGINPKAEQTENRLRIRSMRNKWRQSRMNHDSVNFGRK